MKRFRIVFAVIALIAALTVAASPSASARRVPNIAGLWHGSYRSATTSATGHWTAHFHQSGSQVTGSITINPSCITTGSISGTISGYTITFGQVHNGHRTITFQGTISADATHMHGTWHSPPACGGDHGTWRGHHA